MKKESLKEFTDAVAKNLDESIFGRWTNYEILPCGPERCACGPCITARWELNTHAAYHSGMTVEETARFLGWRDTLEPLDA